MELLIVLICLLGIGSIILVWAIKDMEKPPREEIENITTGDFIVVKIGKRKYTHGRVALIERESGWGVIKEARPPYAAHEFKIKDVRQKL